MPARKWTGRAGRRCAWKSAGAVLLGLMSGALGCQGTSDQLRPETANDLPHTAAVERAAPRTMAGGSSDILQVGATEVIPLGSGTVQPSSVASLLQANQAPAETDAAETSAGKEPEAKERKWTAAPSADWDTADAKGKDTSREYKGYKVETRLPSPTEGMVTPTIPAPKEVCPISLADALSRAGVANPIIGIAEQAVVAAVGERLRARVLLMPNVNVGANYDLHNGPLQPSFGGIRKVDRQAVYYGLGANTVAAETIKIPGLFINTPLTDVIFSPLAANYMVTNRRFRARATTNDIFLDVSTTYLDLMEAEARLAIIRQSEKDFDEVVRLTRAYLKAELGVDADYRRAQADLLLLRYAEVKQQQEVAVASADLSELLNLDPSTRLVTGDIPLQVVQFVDPNVPLPKLLDVAVRNHPAILAASANVRASQVRVRQETARPLLPILWTGLSAGDFGGGAVATSSGNVFNPHTGNSDLVHVNSALGQTVPKFGNISSRFDFDVFAYWQLQNMGMGNLGLIRREKTAVGVAQAERLRILNDVREQVSLAFNKSAEHYRAIAIQLQRVREATHGFQNDLVRIRGRVSRPIEVLDNAKRLREAREALLEEVIAFDRAQFRLFTALGQPASLVVADNKAPAAPPGVPAAPGNPPPAEQLPPPNALPPQKQ